MVDLFLLTLMATIAAQLAPGPNFLAVAAAALGQGRMAGMCVAAGVACGVFFWVLLVAFGLGSLLELVRAKKSMPTASSKTSAHWAETAMAATATAIRTPNHDQSTV